MNPFDLQSKLLMGLSATLAVLLLGAGIFATKQTLKLSALRVELADTRAGYAEDGRKQALARAALTDTYRARERSWGKTFEELSNEAQKQTDLAQSHRADAATAGEQLRQRAAELAARPGGSASGPGAAASGAPAGSARDLLADMSRRLDAAAESIAKFADDSSLAGQTCVRAYSAVKGPP